MPARLGTLDDERVDAERDGVVGFGHASHLDPDLRPARPYAPDLLRVGQRPEEDHQRDPLLNHDVDVFAGDEVADEIDAERSVGEAAGLANEVAQDVRRADVAADGAQPSGVADRRGELGPGDHGHSGIDDGSRETEVARDGRFEHLSNLSNGRGEPVRGANRLSVGAQAPSAGTAPICDRSTISLMCSQVSAMRPRSIR